MGVRDYNREAWDREVERGNEWTVPVGPDVIEAARMPTYIATRAIKQ
jgi:hypothetical protein